MGGACIMPDRDEKCIRFSFLENLKERYHLEDIGLDGKMI